MPHLENRKPSIQNKKKANLICLVQAFVISLIVYVTPYLCTQVSEQEKIELSGVYKQALSVPFRTATDKLLALSVHNTLGELRGPHDSTI